MYTQLQVFADLNLRASGERDGEWEQKGEGVSGKGHRVGWGNENRGRRESEGGPVSMRDGAEGRQMCTGVCTLIQA